MKILIVTKNWLGDMVFQMPAIEKIRECYPSAEIVTMAPERCRGILESHPSVQRVMTFDEKKEHRFFLKRWWFAWRLRSEKFDRVYLFHRSKTRALLCWLAGIKERIGFETGRGKFLTQSFPEPQGKTHQVDYFLHLISASEKMQAEGACYQFYFSKKDSEQAASKLGVLWNRPFVVFHLGANWEPKRWPPQHFAKLADLIHEKWGFSVVVTGGPQDAVLEREMRSAVQSAAVTSLVGSTNLKELGAIFKQSVFVVSGDSGPMHIASGSGAPVIALFGPTDPDLTGPRGIGPSRVLKFIPKGYSVPWYGEPHELPQDGWLSQITPEAVMTALEKENWANRAELTKRIPQ